MTLGIDGSLPLVLAADVGGTNCRMALFQGTTMIDHRRVPSRGPSLTHVLHPFLCGQRVQAACVSVAAPIRGQRAEMTNHPWTIDQAELSQMAECPVLLVNDFVAAARGVPELGDEGRIVLQQGAPPPPDAPIAVIGPGTGLGQALLIREGADWRVLPSQGGHVDFGPTDTVELDLIHWMRHRDQRVSYEHILSGDGLLALYSYFVARGSAGVTLAEAAQVVAADTPAAQQAIARFCRILGSFAGNVALSTLCLGGLTLCGGIAPRLDLVTNGFLQAFLNKGKMAALMPDFPITLVTDPHIALRGAAALAERMLGNEPL